MVDWVESPLSVKKWMVCDLVGSEKSDLASGGRFWKPVAKAVSP